MVDEACPLEHPLSDCIVAARSRLPGAAPTNQTAPTAVINSSSPNSTAAAGNVTASDARPPHRKRVTAAMIAVPLAVGIPSGRRRRQIRLREECVTCMQCPCRPNVESCRQQLHYVQKTELIAHLHPLSCMCNTAAVVLLALLLHWCCQPVSVGVGPITDTDLPFSPRSGSSSSEDYLNTTAVGSSSRRSR